jgi:hypothetical protein
MTHLLYRTDAWQTALILFACMVATWIIGMIVGRRLTRIGKAVMGSKVGEASLGLMGLLLAFTFAMAIEKHGTRREMVVQDANAIGDFYTTASLLKDPTRSQLQSVIRDYAHYRLDFVQRPIPSEADLDDAIAQINSMQTHMTNLVREAVDANTPVVEPLVDTLNNLTSMHAARLAAGRDRLQWPIVGLLALSAMVSTGLLGREQGIAGKRHYLSTVGFMMMVGFALYLTFDLNQPHRGLMRVSQEPLERLIKSIDQPSPGPG